MRAAQYVRMSTERQEYSIPNQMAAIASYASLHQFEIVRTYSDPARSGLDIKRRPGLQSLIDDVVGGRADYEVILVFDVSRWGRFQDSDEAACYEFLCKRAGIMVHYCAEPFSNDGSLTSTLVKVVKRTMAAEYLRELSAKVHAGHCRLAANGFKAGGRAGLGLRRLLLDSNGTPKAILRDGERKSLMTERVTYTLGPDDEVRTVRLIYSMFLEQDLSVRSIARLLNEQGTPRGSFGPWDHNAVSAILTHPKYAGCILFNRSSETLRSKRTRNPRDKWVLRQNCFPGIVPMEVFNRAQEKLNNLVNRRSNERLLADLRGLVEKHGKITPDRLKPVNGVASAATYYARFGGLMSAYELIGYRGARYTKASLEGRRIRAKLKVDVVGQLKHTLQDANLPCSSVGALIRVRGCGYFDIEMARCFKTSNGHLRWLVRARQDCSRHHLIIIRLLSDNASVKDFVLLRRVPSVIRYFTLTDAMAGQGGTVCVTGAEVVVAMSQFRKSKKRPIP